MEDHLVVKVFKIGLHLTGLKLWKHVFDESLSLFLFFFLPFLFILFYLGRCLAFVGYILLLCFTCDLCSFFGSTRPFFRSARLWLCLPTLELDWSLGLLDLIINLLASFGLDSITALFLIAGREVDSATQDVCFINWRGRTIAHFFIICWPDSPRGGNYVPWLALLTTHLFWLGSSYKLSNGKFKFNYNWGSYLTYEGQGASSGSIGQSTS